MLPGMNGSQRQTPKLLQDQGMFRRDLLSALNIAAFITWLAICIAVIEPVKLLSVDLREWSGLAALLGFMVLYVTRVLTEPAGAYRQVALVIAQALLVLLAEWTLRSGQNAVLMIIIAGQLVLLLPLRGFLIIMLALNTGLALIWMQRGLPLSDALISLLMIGSFQGFAALTGHYADTRERAREHLAQVNVELLATRRLLEESARAGERLKLSRELHDVAGHSLTALKLNLARLARDPALAQREELLVSSMLADDLLSQIRQVVSTLRAHDGLDLRAAMQTLVRPMPGVHIVLDIEEHLRVDDIEQAEALLRCAQEAITNALRHGRAGEIRLGLSRIDGMLELSVINDGNTPQQIDFGNGLTGMRERLNAVGGTLDITPTPPRGLRLVARIPTAPGHAV